VRDVPDHQEVFVDARGACAIVEVVERQEAVADGAAARFFWADLAAANDASGEADFADLAGAPALAAAGAALRARAGAGAGARLGPLVAASGLQILPSARGRARAARVWLAALRLPAARAELLLSVSAPAPAAAAALLGDAAAPDGTPPAPGGAPGDDEPLAAAAAAAAFFGMLATLEVRDWGLFDAA